MSLANLNAAVLAVAGLVFLPTVWRVSERAGKAFGDWVLDRVPRTGHGGGKP